MPYLDIGVVDIPYPSWRITSHAQLVTTMEKELTPKIAAALVNDSTSEAARGIIRSMVYDWLRDQVQANRLSKIPDYTVMREGHRFVLTLGEP